MNTRDSIDNNKLAILKCLKEGSAQDIKTFFEKNKRVLNWYIHGKPIINALLQFRYLDKNLDLLLESLKAAGVNLFACNKSDHKSSLFSLFTFNKEGERSALHELIKLLRQYPDKFDEAVKNSFLYLLNYGLDINQLDENGFTPLALATCHFEKINVDLVLLLLKHNPTPIFTYGSDHKDHVLATLVDLYSSMNMTGYETDEGQLRFLAKEQAVFDTMRLLILFGADLNFIVDVSVGRASPNEKISIRDYMLKVSKNNREELAKLVEFYDNKQSEAVEKTNQSCSIM